MSVIIYRVETITGLGPWSGPNNDWNAGAGSGWCRNAHSIHNHLVTYLGDNRGSRGDCHRFGFLTFDQFLNYAFHPTWEREYRWFNEIMTTMETYSQGISIYETESLYTEVLGDATQVIFDVTKSKRLKFLQYSSHKRELDLLYNQSLETYALFHTS